MTPGINLQKIEPCCVIYHACGDVNWLWHVICSCYPQAVSNKDAVYSFNVPFTGFQWLKSSCISLSTYEITAVPKRMTVPHVNNKYKIDVRNRYVGIKLVEGHRFLAWFPGTKIVSLQNRIVFLTPMHAVAILVAGKLKRLWLYVYIWTCMHANCKNYFVRTGKVIAVSGFIEQAIEEIKPSQPIELAETLVC